jgi:hypothetical protein
MRLVTGGAGCWFGLVVCTIYGDQFKATVIVGVDGFADKLTTWTCVVIDNP